MIVGLDETGDFSDGSRTFFAAAMVRPGAIPAVDDALRRWERETRQRLNLVNEIKGAQIDCAAAEAFVSNVIGAGDGGSVLCRFYGIDVNAESRSATEVQRRLLVTGYEDWASSQKSSGDPKRQKFGRYLEQQSKWLRSRSVVELLKLLTVARIVPELIEMSFGYSISRGHPLELVDLSVQIDRGYVSDRNRPIWLDILRNTLIHGTRTRPIPIPTDWPEDHPVREAFVEREKGPFVVLKQSFRERVGFFDSQSTSVIRVADVLAAILRRGLDDGPLGPASVELQRFVVRDRPYTLFELTESAPVAAPNPYDLFRSTESA